MKTYTVKVGDTLTKISASQKITVNEIMRLNGISNPNKISIGQVLKLEDEKSGTYTVKKGDNLSSIAASLGCSISDLKSRNEIKNDFLSVGQVLAVPNSQPKWNFPTLPWNRYNNSVGKFLDQEYLRIIGDQHPGADINGNGGGDTDLGAPVYAVSDGVVVDAQHYRVWGNIVKIYHPHEKVWSVYAHLKDVKVKVGQKVSGRTLIGTIGKGDKNVYLAHLHFEIRTSDFDTPFWPSSKYGRGKPCIDFINQHYKDPIKFLISKKAETV